jgi:hypothetical protein
MDRRRIIFLLDTQNVGGCGRVPFSVVDNVTEEQYIQGTKILVAQIFN